MDDPDRRSDNLKAVYRGRPADFSIKLCLANSQNMNWEVIEPIRGQSIYVDFLDEHGEGASQCPSTNRALAVECGP